MNKLRTLSLIIMLGALIASGSFFYQTYVHRSSALAKLPVLGEVKNFSLTDSKKQIISLKDLKGQLWVADFMFTTCSGICPTMTKNLAKLHKSYAQAPDVLMVSISVNPDTDTPDVLQRYAQKYKADTSKWLFLTGTTEKIKEIAVGSFKLGAIDEPVFHSSYFTLVDRSAHIRGYYDGTDDAAVQKLFHDIARLKKEH